MDKIYFPFYQVKVAGKVVDHTNNHAAAHSSARISSAKPSEVWLIHEKGNAQLLYRSA